MKINTLNKIKKPANDWLYKYQDDLAIRKLQKATIELESESLIARKRKVKQEKTKNLKAVIRNSSINGLQKKLLILLASFEPNSMQYLKLMTGSKNIRHLITDTRKSLKKRKLVTLQIKSATYKGKRGYYVLLHK